jgi:hypothetical protein
MGRALSEHRLPHERGEHLQEAAHPFYPQRFYVVWKDGQFWWNLLDSLVTIAQISKVRGHGTAENVVWEVKHVAALLYVFGCYHTEASLKLLNRRKIEANPALTAFEVVVRLYHAVLVSEQ